MVLNVPSKASGQAVVWGPVEVVCSGEGLCESVLALTC